MNESDWAVVEQMSQDIEFDDGWDSLDTMLTNYPKDERTGAFICVFPSCGFRRHSHRDMFKHVHFGPHGNSYGMTFAAFCKKAASTYRTRSDKVTMEQVVEAASEVFKPEGVTIWIDAPNPRLNNATPRQFVDAGDGQRVLDLLTGYAEGSFA
jgi:hypothetical protein